MNANVPEVEPARASAPGLVVWLTGLPSSGKSTLAEVVRQRLSGAGRPCCALDGDAVRRAIVPAPGYTPEARDAFYATLGRLAAMLAAQGLVVLVPATAHRTAYRTEARAIAPSFVEVHVRVDPEECARRDAKGLYAEVRAGSAAGLPGADLAYEAPEAPDVIASGGLDEAAAARIVALVEERLEAGRARG